MTFCCKTSYFLSTYIWCFTKEFLPVHKFFIYSFHDIFTRSYSTLPFINTHTSGRHRYCFWSLCHGGVSTKSVIYKELVDDTDVTRYVSLKKKQNVSSVVREGSTGSVRSNESLPLSTLNQVGVHKKMEKRFMYDRIHFNYCTYFVTLHIRWCKKISWKENEGLFCQKDRNLETERVWI